MRTRILRSGLLVAMLSLSTTTYADDMEAIEKKISDAWGTLKSMSAKMTMKMEMTSEAFSMVSDSTGTYEFLRKGDTMLYRMEMKTASSSKMGDQETKNDSTNLSVCDGEYDYNLSEAEGQKTATKSKANKANLDPKSWLSGQKEMFNMKVMPDEKVEGFDCWVIEATPKSPEQAAAAGKSMWYYAKDFGMPLKYVAFGPDGKPTQTMTYTDVKVNQDISPDRFVFKAPEGVTVTEMPSAPMPSETPAAPDNP